MTSRTPVRSKQASNSLRRSEVARHSSKGLSTLYKRALKASRTGPLFSAFPYPTKISPEAIALFIASHTAPGDTVFDGFAGSGTTGIAALLCGSPTAAMRDEAQRLGLTVQWGPRRAILRELGTLGSFVARTLCGPPDPAKFRREAERILATAECELGWMYEATDPSGLPGTIRYSIWSERLKCPPCGRAATFWDASVRREPARINSTMTCPHCSRRSSVRDSPRVTKRERDPLTGDTITSRARKPVWLYGSTGTRDWSRPIVPSDRSLIAQIAKVPLPDSIPCTPIPWGDLYRSGYHQGITHLHNFYTRRNLVVFATLWKLAETSSLRDALRFWLLSYNASHGTIMTRVVAKKGQRDLVVTSAQPGVLYVSGLPVEKNLFAGLRRKLDTIHAAFALTRRAERLVEVQKGSSLITDLPDQSIDYVFTDPPFGGNIPYAEVNFVNEAWLGDCTDARDEVTISRVQRKSVIEYETLMAQAFRELGRILKDDARATVVFHSSASKVWNALGRAYVAAGFRIELASILEKTQGSFKQVTTDGAVKGDPTLLLRKQQGPRARSAQAVIPLVKKLLERARDSGDDIERTPQRLYSRFINHFLTRQQVVPLDADEFYQLIAHGSLRPDAGPSIEQ